MNKLRLKLFSLLCQFAEIHQDNGVLIIDKDLEVGAEVFIGEEPAGDGKYTKEDGTVIVVEDGKVKEIIEAVEEEVKPEETVVEEPEALAEETPAVEEPEAPAEPDPKDAMIEELNAKIAELEAVIAEKDARIAELEENPPVDKPLGEEKYSAEDIKRNPALRYFKR